MENLGSHSHGLLLTLGAYGTNHELLESDGRVGVGSAIDDVHHGHGHHVGVAAANVAIERQSQGLGGSVGGGQGDTQDGVGAELALGGSAVEGYHFIVECALVEDIVAHECGCDDIVHIVHSLEHPLAPKAALVAVAKLQGLILTSGSARRHTGTAHNAILQCHFHFYCRIAT